MLGKENTYEKVNHHHPRTYYDAVQRTRSGRRSAARDHRKNATDGDNGTSGAQVPEDNETTVETAFVGEVNKTETAVEIKETTVNENEVVTEEHEVFTEEKTPTAQETVTDQCTEITEDTVTTESKEETVECIDEGNQCLAEYKPQIGGQPNPFENDMPTEIDGRPVEDYVGEGEDRPGEGKHF